MERSKKKALLRVLLSFRQLESFVHLLECKELHFFLTADANIRKKRGREQTTTICDDGFAKKLAHTCSHNERTQKLLPEQIFNFLANFDAASLLLNLPCHWLFFGSKCGYFESFLQKYSFNIAELFGNRQKLSEKVLWYLLFGKAYSLNRMTLIFVSNLSNAQKRHFDTQERK